MCVQCYAISSALLIFYRVFPLLHSSARLFNKLKLLNQNKNKKKENKKRMVVVEVIRIKKIVSFGGFIILQLFDNKIFFLSHWTKQQKQVHVLRLRFPIIYNVLLVSWKYFLNHAVENICLNVSLPVSCVFFFSPFLTVIFHTESVLFISLMQ